MPESSRDEQPVLKGATDASPSPDIEQACRKFADAWHSRRHPRLEDYVYAAPEAARRKLVQGLIEEELQLRRQAAEAVSPDEYLDRFPERTHLISEVAESTSSKLSSLTNFFAATVGLSIRTLRG